MKHFISCFTSKYAAFSGRAGRKEYWMFILFDVIAAFVALVLDIMISAASGRNDGCVFYLLYLLASLIPTLTVSVRRLHDTGRSGWWLLLSFVPFGGIVLFAFTLLPGDSGANEYGEDPNHGR